MVESPRLGNGWRNLSIEDRGFLLTLAFGSRTSIWSVTEVSIALGVDENRGRAFVAASVAAGVLAVGSRGEVTLVEPPIDLRISWERRFHEVFWPAITSPWKKVGRVNALKVWKSSTFLLINPKTEAGADALCETILDGVERYKRLLGQPNAPSMKYVEGWLAGERWTDEIDDGFIARHAKHPGQLDALNPLERARRRQSEQQAPTNNTACASAEQNEFATPAFIVSL